MRPVVVIGSFNVDHVWRSETLPRPGETLSGLYAGGPGGKGFNQAVAAARAGAATAFVCALGDDVGGQRARALATADGIDLRDECSAAPTGAAGIFVDANGRNSIVVGPGANATLSIPFIDAQSDLLRSAHVALVQLESPAETVAAALRHARAGGAIAMLNPAPANVALPIDILALADILTPNETECAALFARHLGERIEGEAIAELDSPKLHALCRELLPGGTVVVTLGAAGCFVSHADAMTRGDDNVWYRLAAEPAQAVDTTGAGDAFNGALAAALATAAHGHFAACARFANRYAAHSTERHGAALSMPTLQELDIRFPG
ncbi:MAG: ribokinase [Lysobacteraceae bacterium]|nr:MAG: ribokinase [Xanthomonadaceae bacterium]